MSTEQQADVSPSATPSFSEILDAHAKLETQVGELYITFAATFAHDPGLRALWGGMALDEGGHAALVRAVNKGLLSGVLQAKSLLLPVEMLDSLATRVAEYHRQAQAGPSLDQALRITWELECSELEFMRELLISSSSVAELGFPTTLEESRDTHVGRLREAILRYSTDEGLRREVKFLSAERPPGEDANA
jgi:hypothetical protein